jgi:hypothetical protein
VLAGLSLRVRKPNKAPGKVEAGGGKGERRGEFMDHFGDRYGPSPHTVLRQRSSAPGSPGQPGSVHLRRRGGVKPLEPLPALRPKLTPLTPLTPGQSREAFLLRWADCLAGCHPTATDTSQQNGAPGIPLALATAHLGIGRDFQGMQDAEWSVLESEQQEPLRRLWHRVLVKQLSTLHDRTSRLPKGIARHCEDRRLTFGGIELGN